MDDELVEGVNIEGGPCGNLIEIQSGNWPLPKNQEPCWNLERKSHDQTHLVSDS